MHACVWRVTSDANTFLTMEVLNMDIGRDSYVAFGNGLGLSTPSSLVANETDVQSVGTLYFFDGNQMWMLARTFGNGFDLEVKLFARRVKGHIPRLVLNGGIKSMTRSWSTLLFFFFFSCS